jgi:hypothetical protein
MAHLLHIDWEGECLCLEEVEPQILVVLDPKVPLTYDGEAGRLSDGIRVEVVELHPIVMLKRWHEEPHQHPEPPLM